MRGSQQADREKVEPDGGYTGLRETIVMQVRRGKTGGLVLGVFSALLGVHALGLGGCQSSQKREGVTMAEPVDGWEGVKNVSRSGRYTFAGQPTEAALGQYAQEGGAMVIDLRAQEGGDSAGFDERARVEGLGMRYVQIPMSPDTFSKADVKRFAEATRATEGPVLVHCGTSNRVGGMWAAYLALEEGIPTEEAIAGGKAAGMSSEGVEEAARRVIGR